MFCRERKCRESVLLIDNLSAPDVCFLWCLALNLLPCPRGGLGHHSFALLTCNFLSSFLGHGVRPHFSLCSFPGLSLQEHGVPSARLPLGECRKWRWQCSTVPRHLPGLSPPVPSCQAMCPNATDNFIFPSLKKAKVSFLLKGVALATVTCF